MSANNVFVPYKYHDGDVKQLGNYATTVRDYVDYLERMFDKSEKVYYRGEEDGNDLSELTEDTIRQIHGYKNEGYNHAQDPEERYAWFLDAWIGWVHAGSRRDKQKQPILEAKEKTA